MVNMEAIEKFADEILIGEVKIPVGRTQKTFDKIMTI